MLSEGGERGILKKNALFFENIVCIFANIRKKPYLCTIKITNSRAAQLVKHCTEDMTQEQALKVISEQARILMQCEEVVNMLKDCKSEKEAQEKLAIATFYALAKANAI